MEDKPVTSLVLFQPLKLVPWESLPNKFTNKLAETKQQRQWALDTLRSSLVPACITSVAAVGFAFATICMLFTGAPFLVYLLAASVVGGFSIVSFFSIYDHKRCVDAYRQITVSPQLQIGAQNEFFASEMVNTANNAVVIWNKRAQCAPPEDMDERYVLALKKERAVIVSKIEKVKKVIEAIKKDGFDSEE